MRYPEHLIYPMREELTRHGVEEAESGRGDLRPHAGADGLRERDGHAVAVRGGKMGRVPILRWQIQPLDGAGEP